MELAQQDDQSTPKYPARVDIAAGGPVALEHRWHGPHWNRHEVDRGVARECAPPVEQGDVAQIVVDEDVPAGRAQATPMASISRPGCLTEPASSAHSKA
jgi:hypothetical protein